MTIKFFQKYFKSSFQLFLYLFRLITKCITFGVMFYFVYFFYQNVYVVFTSHVLQSNETVNTVPSSIHISQYEQVTAFHRQKKENGENYSHIQIPNHFK